MKVNFFINGDGFEMREAVAISEELAESGVDTVVFDWNDSETESLARIYDIYSTPSVLVTTNSGGFIELWQGSLPRIEEIKYQIR